MLHGDEIRADQWDMVDLAEHPDDTRMVDSRNHDGQQIGEEVRLLLQVESERLVVAVTQRLAHPHHIIATCVHLDVSHPNNHVLELIVFPCI